MPVDVCMSGVTTQTIRAGNAVTAFFYGGSGAPIINRTRQITPTTDPATLTPDAAETKYTNRFDDTLYY